MKKAKMILGILILFTLIGITFFIKFKFNKNLEKNIYIEKNIEIEKGSSLTSAADVLKKEGIIESAHTFKKFMIDNEYAEKLQPGIFSLNSDMTYLEISSLLTQVVKRETLRITIKEGLTNKEIAMYLNKKMGLSEEKFLELCSDPSQFDTDKYTFLKLLDKDATLEGYLFPETYDVYTESSEKDVVEKLIGQFQSVFNSEISDIMSENNLNEIIIMASLVEAEAKLDSERGKIASVFYNRLKNGTKLESCATVQYALGEHKERLLYEDLEIDSPYNTYKFSGLPVGPIGNPGLESIRGAINPEKTDYLFFTYNFDGTGTHTFTKNLAEHNKATEKARKNRGI